MVVRRRLWVLLALVSLIADTDVRAAGPESIPLSGPELDAVPGPVIDASNLPAAATWLVARYEHPLRLLAILDKGESAAPYQRIARRLRASLELRYIAAGDDRYHVNDKWIEPSDNPTLKELVAESRKIANESIAPAGPRTYDVIFLHRGLEDRERQENLMRFLKAGGVVAAAERAQKPAFKGMELYSWKPEGKDWHFSLLTGTNRLKTTEEITRPDQAIVGMANLRKRLSTLAIGESVFWRNLAKKPVPEDMAKELKSLCEGIRVKLQRV